MPKASAAPVSQELLPPLLVRQGPGPALEGIEVMVRPGESGGRYVCELLVSLPVCSA
jgi:hypothetical protein